MKQTISLAADVAQASSSKAIKVVNAKETYALVKDAIEHQTRLLGQIHGSAEHPQVALEIAKTQARIDAFEAIATSLTGKHAYLRIYTH